jgi:hypothetical protein
VVIGVITFWLVLVPFEYAGESAVFVAALAACRCLLCASTGPLETAMTRE